MSDRDARTAARRAEAGDLDAGRRAARILLRQVGPRVLFEEAARGLGAFTPDDRRWLRSLTDRLREREIRLTVDGDQAERPAERARLLAAGHVLAVRIRRGGLLHAVEDGSPARARILCGIRLPRSKRQRVSPRDPREPAEGRWCPTCLATASPAGRPAP